MLIKVQFLKGDKPSGRAYTYRSDVLVKVGDKVQINSSAKGIVTEIDVPEEEVAAFADKVKSIMGLVESVNAVVKNWSLLASTDTGFTAPELLHMHLQGNVYGRQGFCDGDPINTSRIVGIEDVGDHKVIITRTGSKYSVYPEDVDSDCEKQFPRYYERLRIIKESEAGNEGTV